MSGTDTEAEGRLRILLVEDNPGDARYIREMLKETAELAERAVTRGRSRLAEVTATERDPGGEPAIVHETRLVDAVERLDEDPADVVLLDLDLPDSAGLETVESVREHSESVPVVVLTGLRDREAGMSALSRGAEEYLVKDEINADLLIRSIYHAIERKAHERELEQYRTLIETVNDGIYAVDDESRIVLANEALVAMSGYSREELLGSPSSLLIDRAVLDRAGEAGEPVGSDAEDRGAAEATLHTAEGDTIPVETNVSPFPLGDGRFGWAGVVRDVTERKERERQLERQRNQLATLNSLNEIVHEISHLAIESSTREEIEALVCEHLADADPYLFAWIGEVDESHETITLRTEAGVEGYLDDVTIRIDDTPEGQGPTGRAVRTGEMQVARDVLEDPEYEPWHEHARRYGYRSSAAIPIEYEDTLYAVLNVYSERPDAFDDEERAVVGGLGAVIGHAINAVERKRALMSEDVVEIRFQVNNLLDTVGVGAGGGGRITFDRVVPVADGVFLEYGTVEEEAIETLRSLVDTVPHFDSVQVFEDEGGTARFELRLTEPPAISTIASAGGRIESAVVEDGDFTMVVHVPPSTDVSRVVDAVQGEYPDAEVVAQRQTTQRDPSSTQLESVLLEDLTERQRAALESAYFSGFFEWPRDSSGEDIAESMGIAAATFHQHVRMGERKLLRALFEGSEADR